MIKIQMFPLLGKSVQLTLTTQKPQMYIITSLKCILQEEPIISHDT